MWIADRYLQGRTKNEMFYLTVNNLYIVRPFGFFLYKVRNVSFTRIKSKEKDNLPNQMIEKYTYSFSIFSHVADIDDRKMQSSYSFVYVCFACLMGVMILCHHSTINIIIDCIEKERKKRLDQSLNERKIILDFINQLNSTRFYIKGIIMMNQFVIDGKK